MKKFLSLLLMMGLLFSCDDKRVTTTDNTDDNKSAVESDYCYQYQLSNELGELLDAELYHDCMVYVRNAGNNFEEAFESVEPELEAMMQRLTEETGNTSGFVSDDILTRQQEIKVLNAPKETLRYISVDIYMYSTIYKDYIIVRDFYVIDSEGNLYKKTTAPD